MPLGDAGALSLLAVLAVAQLVGAARGSRGLVQALVLLLFVAYVVVAGLFVMGVIFKSEGTPWLFITATLVVNAVLAGGVMLRRWRRMRPGIE